MTEAPDVAELSPHQQPILAVLAALPAAVWVFDAKDRLVFANAAARDGAGPAAPPPGTPLVQVLPHAFRDFPEAGDPALFLHDRRRADSRRLRRHDGRDFEWRSVPLPGGGFLLQQVEVPAGPPPAMLDNLRHGIALFDASGRLAVANRLAGQLGGVSDLDRYIGRPVAEIIAAQVAAGEFGHGEAAAATLAAALALDRSRPGRYTRTRPDGTVVEVASDPTPDGGFVITHSDVTARARAEAAAQEQAAMLAATLDNLRHGVAVFGPDRRLRVANALAVELSGCPPELATPGRSIEALANALLGSEDFADPEAQHLAQAALAADLATPLVHVRTKPDGRVLEVRFDPAPDGGFILTYVDVTRLARAEAEARRRAAMLQTMQDTMRHGIALFGPDHRLIIANSLAAGLAGLEPGAELPPGITPGGLAQLQAERGLFGSGPEAMADAVARSAGRDRRKPHQARRRMPDGQVVDSASDPTPDGGFVITWTDVTALVRAEDAAGQRAATLQAMIENMRHGVALFGADCRLMAANRLLQVLGGFSEAALRPGRLFEELVAEQRASEVTGDPALDRRYAALALDSDRSRPMRYIRPARDGRVLEIASDPMPDGGFVVTVSDITALARAEAEAEQRAAMLRAALDHMRHGIMLFGPDRRLLASNALLQEIGGLLPEELAPGTLLDDQIRRQHARGVFGSGPEADAVLRRLLGTDRSKPSRHIRTGTDGRIIEVFTDPTPDGGFVVTFTDITARARAEAEAQQRAATLQVTLDNLRHGVALYGPDHRLRLANRLAGPNHNRLDLAQRIGMRFDALIAEQQRLGLLGEEPEAARIAAGLTALDRSQPQRYQRRMPDGRVLDVASDPTPEGGFIVTQTDVTALEQAKAEASDRAAVLQVMLENIQHGIAYFGPDRRLIARNRLAEELTGLGLDGLPVGATLDEIAGQQAALGVFGDSEVTTDFLRMGLALDRSRPARYLRRTPAGRTIEIASNPAPDGGFVITYTDVTGLLEAQAAAADRAALLQVMLDSMRHGFALFDPDLRLVAANALASEFNGLPPGAFRPGRTVEELAAEALAAGVITADSAHQIIEADYTTPQRHIRYRPDGRVVEVFTDPMPDGGFVASYSDITALTRAEAEARERAGTLLVMLDNTRHGICYYGPDRRVIAANALASEFGGHPPGTLRPGRSLDELIGEQIRLGALGAEGAAIGRMALGMDRSRPARYLRTTPAGRILEVTSDPTPDGGFVVTSADITALARAEAEARQRAAILQAMLDNSRQGIVLFDAEGLVVAANALAADLNGLPPEGLRPARPIQEVIEEQAARGYLDPEVLAEALAMVPRDQPWPVPYARQRRLNGRLVEVTTDRAGEAGYIRSYRDISEEQHARAELERARDAAEAANRAKSRFLATITHELRTPLNAVIGFSEAFLADRDPVRGQEYVRAIHEAGRHLLSLIDDILDVTRSETTGFAVTESLVAVAALAEGAVRVMQATAASVGVTVEAALPPGLPLVRADELRLRQVLLNLLSNAVKFTPAGGSVTLAAMVEPVGDLVVTVTDTGMGMRPEDIPRAFEAFTQLDSSLSRRFPGSGLGLYLSRALAEAQGASLSLESAPGAGTTALLRFPKDRLLAELAA